MSKHSTANAPIAVIGMACRLPGADSLEDFWPLIRDGRSMVQPLPESRFNRELFYQREKGVLGKSYTDLGCLIDYESMPELPGVFAATPEVAYRTLATVAYEACQQARWPVDRLSQQNGGVYLGHTRSSGLSGDISFANYLEQTASQLSELEEFKDLTGSLNTRILKDLVTETRRDYPCRDSDGGPELGASVPAFLIGAGLRLNGPAMSFNSACASSLNALAQAVRALQRGQIDVAVAGGASHFHSDTLVLFSQAQSLSATGTRPFDEDADGLVVGEGYIVLILKTLRKALSDGDPIQAVIRSVGISADGKGKSLWAPRAEGQVAAVRRAYERGLEMQRLQYVEAHATSTQLGDATEIAALNEALGPALLDKIPLGSVKGNIGHTLEVAGIAGLLKTILCLQQQTIPPVANLRTPNSEISWGEIPFYAPTVAQSWEAPDDGGPRRAGVNSFGIGGLNAHVVVDEYTRTASRSFAMPRSDHAQGVPEGPGKNHAEQGVAVVGMGAVLPGALTMAAFADLLSNGEDAKGEIPLHCWDANIYFDPEEPVVWRSQSKVGGVIEEFSYDWRRHKIPPKQIAHASPLQFMVLDAVDQAFQHAGYDHRELKRDRIGVLVGNCFGGQFAIKLMMGLRLPEIHQRLRSLVGKYRLSPQAFDRVWERCREQLLQMNPALLDQTGSYTASVLASRITKSFDLMGGAVSVDAGHVSAGAAIDCSVDLILSGDCEMMVCVAGQEDLSPSQYEGWGLRGKLSVGRPGVPFTNSANGSVPGDGCGVLLLKNLSQSQQDGDLILGIIRGVGAGRTKTVRTASALASDRALRESDLKSADVGYVEVSGCGVVETDENIIQGVDEVYGKGRQTPLLLGSLASQVGHLTGAAGMAAACKVIHALDARAAPATVGEGVETDCVKKTGYMKHVASERELLSSNADGRLAASVHCCDERGAVYHILIERGEKVEQKHRRASDPMRHSDNGASLDVEGVLHFDATQRRKGRLRKSAERQAVVPNIPEQPTAVEEELPRPPARVQNENLAGTENRRAVPESDELERFLLIFVVEETGYPVEMVDLDADLEADLGIDSIKKAQMLGELRDAFGLEIEASDELSLDDFSTLRHILEFVVETLHPSTTTVDGPVVEMVREERPVAAAQAIASEPTLPMAARGGNVLNAEEVEAFMIDFIVEETGYPPEMVELEADLEADLGIDSIKKAQMLGETRDHFQIDMQVNEDLSLDDFPTLKHIVSFVVTETSADRSPLDRTPAERLTEGTLADGTLADGQVSREIDAAVVALPDDGDEKQLNSGELLDFMMRFVVAETGYPEEMVEADADLEADLGIDSIKKAQMLAELRDQYALEIEVQEDISLDDFPTLRHIVDFVVEAAATGTPLPGEQVTSSLQETNASEPLLEREGRAERNAVSASALADFMLGFVIEETGYPPEMVEMGADLEADLGIDSIKKAQMLGELRDEFQLDLVPSEDLSLDDFPTLQHILDYVVATMEQAEYQDNATN